MEKRILFTLLLTGFLSSGFSQTLQKPDLVYTYHISSTFSLDNADFDALAVTEFGAGSSLADWTDVKAWMATLPDGMNSFYSITGMPVAGICYLKRNGIRYWGGRHFFIQQFNSGPPGGFALYDSYLSIYLGTWNGMNIQYMAMVPEGTVPVNMSSFIAVRMENGINISWTTESEQNNLGFKLTRSVNGGVFETIGFINGKGTTSERQSYSYNDRLRVTDHGLRVEYKLFQVDQDGTVRSAGRAEVMPDENSVFVLGTNYPNPFNPETVIPVTLSKEADVRLTVFNTLGQKLAVLLDGKLSAGFYPVTWNSDFSSGLYWVVLEVRNPESGSLWFRDSRKVLLMR